MILTDRFVYVHMPGTGGTFVTAAIDRLYRERVARGVSPRPIDVHKHGTCRDIPTSHRHLPVLCNIRDPYDRYVALYEYRWWEKHDMPGISRAEMRTLFPHFPKLTFAEFLELASSRFNEIETDRRPDEKPGYYTDEVIRFLFRHPRLAVQRLDRHYVASGAYRDDMFDVRLLRTAHLNDDLCAALEDLGFEQRELAEIRELDRITPPRVRLRWRDLVLRHRPRRTVRNLGEYYTPELAELVRRRDWMLFELYPEFDYDPTAA